MKLNKEKVKFFMYQQNKTQKALAKEINTSPVWLSQVIRSDSVSVSMANRIAKGLNVDVTEILLKE